MSLTTAIFAAAFVLVGALIAWGLILRRRYRATTAGNRTAAYLADPNNFYPGAHGKAALNDRGNQR